MLRIKKYRHLSSKGLLIALPLALAGCATAYEPQPLSAAHPASVEGPQAPMPQASNVLRDRPPIDSAARAGEPGVMHEYDHMDHGDMDHGDMDHGDMDHGDMDHGDMDHGDMDHGDMDHGDMDHDGHRNHGGH